MITNITTTDFVIRDRVADNKPSMTRGNLPFDIGDEVLILPYTIGTIIRRANEKWYLIETDALNIHERTVLQYNEHNKMVRYPRFKEDKVIICRFDEMPYTEVVVNDFIIAPVIKTDSVVVRVHKDYRNSYCTAILYDDKMTNVKRTDDGFKVMSYSPSIVSENVGATLKVPNYWLGQEVLLIRW